MVKSRLIRIIGISLIFALALFSLDQAFGDSSVVNDLSWPNCNLKLSKLNQGGIVGVNDGLDYSANPCLSSEALDFHNNYSLYLNTGYPGAGYGLKFARYPKSCGYDNYSCLAYNYGYNDVLYSIKKANVQGVHSFVWWLDVETANSWVNNDNYNRESLLGMIAALHQNTFNPIIGFYSYPGQWDAITNNWLSHFPVWVATGSSLISSARQACSSDSFDDGPIWLTQYTTSLDYNYLCNVKYLDSLKLNLTFSTKILPS